MLLAVQRQGCSLASRGKLRMPVEDCANELTATWMCMQEREYVSTVWKYVHLLFAGIAVRGDADILLSHAVKLRRVCAGES